MSETAEQIYERAMAAADADGRLPMPPVEDWDTFPFEGDLRVRPLLPPADEPPRLGEGGRDDCWRCQRGDAGALWRDERWRVVSRDEPFGLPVVVILETREHMDLPDLPDDLAADFGRLVVRIERAVRAVGNIGRVHVGRWGDGGAHFHAWFMGRPARLPQLRTSFAAIWDDILPPTPQDVWRANLETVARALAAA